MELLHVMKNVHVIVRFVGLPSKDGWKDTQAGMLVTTCYQVVMQPCQDLPVYVS